MNTYVNVYEDDGQLAVGELIEHFDMTGWPDISACMCTYLHACMYRMCMYTQACTLEGGINKLFKYFSMA
jgi:hypothetical protein